MTDIITILYLLISMYAVNPALPSQEMAQGVFAEYQLNGMEAAVNMLEDTIPGTAIQNEISDQQDTSVQAGVPNQPEVPGKPGAADLTDSSTPDPGKNSSAASDGSKNSAPDSAAENTTKAAITPAKLDYPKELTKLGFYEEESVDKNLNLRNAVLRFQSSCNMTVNGKWDDKCLKALTKILSDGDTGSMDAITSPPSEDMWITINKTRRILTLYEGNHVLKKYPVSIGNPTSLTPEGKYTIVNKVIDPYWGGGGYAKPIKGGLPSNPLGHRWLGLSYKTGSDLGIHGNNSPYSIGKNISHGCIRMINSDVEELFEVVPKSTVVWIGTDTLLKGWGIEMKG